MPPGPARVARSPGCGPAPGRPRSGGRRLALAGTGLRSPPRPRPWCRSRPATPGRPCGDPPGSLAGSARATHHLEGTAGGPRRSPPPGRPPWSGPRHAGVRCRWRLRPGTDRVVRSRRPGRPRRRPGRSSVGTWKRWAGPLARPGDAEKPRRTPSSRSSSVTGSGGAARTAASGPPTSSSKFRDASASHGADRLGGLGTGGRNLELVPAGGAQGGDRVEALRVGGSPPVGEVAHLHHRVEGGRRLHEPRRRPGVQPVRVRDGHPGHDGLSLGAVGGRTPRRRPGCRGG